jgi:serine-type D-Ala-D-Ala carboxypeptidase (penicillin-binding protein 5/6)
VPKRLAVCCALVLIALLAICEPPQVASAPRHRGPSQVPRSDGGVVRVTATAALLVDAVTGQVLYDRSAHLRWPPASTTKVMTALVALDRARLDTPIEVSRWVAHFREGSVVGLPEHARIPLRDLLYALMLPSGNDVALAIAEGVGGSVPAFADLMNEKAMALGATQTHFTAPHGLYDRDHYTTAYDLSLMARAAMENPTFREIVHTRSWMFSVPGRPARRLFNHNRFLSRFPGADGIKTGYVHESGLTLVASATRDGWRLIAVVLHSGDLYGDAARLMNLGFSRYRPTLLASAGDSLTALNIVGADAPMVGTVGEPVYADLTAADTVERRVVLDDHLTLPIRRGTRMGEIRFYASGQLLRAVPLVSASDVHRHVQTFGFLSWMSDLALRYRPLLF